MFPLSFNAFKQFEYKDYLQVQIISTYNKGNYNNSSNSHWRKTFQLTTSIVWMNTGENNQLLLKGQVVQKGAAAELKKKIVCKYSLKWKFNWQIFGWDNKREKNKIHKYGTYIQKRYGLKLQKQENRTSLRFMDTVTQITTCSKTKAMANAAAANKQNIVFIIP